MNRYLFFFLTFFVSTIVTFSQGESILSECYSCKRGGCLLDVTAYDPASLYPEYTDNEGRLTSNGESALQSDYFIQLAELSSNCFRFQKASPYAFKEKNSDFEGIGSRWSPPEYGFKVDIETGLPGTESHPVNERPVVSSLKVLMYFLGEEEELVHTWTALGTLNTDRTFQTTPNGLDRQLERLMKNGPPYYVIASDFEKMPVTCLVSSEKQSVEAGEEIEVTISNLKDSNGRSSREFNRIIVHASEGEILNGEKSELGFEYKVFRLDEVPIKLKYKAPRHSEAPSASITVYNSCDILPTEKIPLRKTARGDHIASYDLLLKHFDWIGDIKISVIKSFNCNEQIEAQLSTKKIFAHDTTKASANIKVGLSDFKLPATGTNARTEIQYTSGQLTTSVNENHQTKTNSQRTQCHNDATGKWEWVSPGNWSDKQEKLTGWAYSDIEGGVNILIVKEMMGDKDAMQDTQKQMAEMQKKLQEAYNKMDKEAMGKLKDDMRNTLQGDQDNPDIPIKVVILITPAIKNYPVYTSSQSTVYNVCMGEYEENENPSGSGEVPLILPVQIEMKGKYIKGKDGNDRIVASIDDTKPFRPTFESYVCPEGQITLSGNITLERNKK